MTSRKSIHIEGLAHLTAIPVASRIGPLLLSSVIAPFDPGTRNVPATLEAQAENIFRHVEKMLAAAGGNWSHVAKMEFWAPTAEARNVIDGPWAKRFPDPESRPARHTHTGAGAALSASFMAWIPE